MSAEQIIQAIAVTAESTGTQLSENAQMVMTEDLMAYPVDKVLEALGRCRRELTGRLSLAAILDRINDGWPSADEAFNSIVEGWGNDQLSILTTQTAQLAAGAAQALLDIKDKTGARMAFKQAYERMVSEKKSQGLEPEWIISAGTNKEHLAEVTKAAFDTGKISQTRALALMPSGIEREEIATGLLLTDEQKRKGNQIAESILQRLSFSQVPSSKTRHV